MEWTIFGVFCLIIVLAILNIVTNYKIKMLKELVNLIDESCRQCFKCQGNTNEKIFYIIHQLEERIVELELKKVKENKKQDKKEDKKDVKRDGTR